MAAASDEEHFATLHEEDACGLCYTSGTTGHPKGVLYSHRAIYLHSLMAAATDTFAISERDVVLPVVPMFHANAWGIPYTGALVGSKLVFTGADMSPQNVVSLLQEEHVTLALGVPTIWNGVLQYLREKKLGLPDLQRMLSGGAPVPLALIRAFKKEFDVEMIQGWGMTEMTPLGCTTHLLRKMDDWPEERQFHVRGQAGFAASLVEMKLLDDAGRELPWDGKSVGELLVRGPCVARAYYNNPAAAGQFTADGWFRTGDVATLDENALLHITDRTKDLIKSGGEWISSVEMENSIMAFPGVLEAAVVARPDPKWDERPVAFVVPQPGGQGVSVQAVIDHLAQTFARWQLPTPEDVRFVEQIPRTSVGKFDKKVLREQFRGA
ncbi:MAG: AMP-binding protein [Candidatus Lambdaproteobacteria bacterium]|nr:AMP-binding protein [Candidatus Lambdaproteobacteria bacterium]